MTPALLRIYSHILTFITILQGRTRQNKAEQGRTRQNKAEQGRTVNQRFEKWIKGSSEKKVHQKKVHEKGPLGKINRITKFSVDSRYLRSMALNVI